MAELIIHGVPDGQEVSKCDKKLQPLFSNFYMSYKQSKATNVSRFFDNMVYTYIVADTPTSKFTSYADRSGSYFGMSLVFNKQYVKDENKVFKLLDTLYNQYVKNKIIKENEFGTKHWMYPHLATKQDEIAVYLGKALSQIMKTNPELNLDKEIGVLPPLQNTNQRN